MTRPPRDRSEAVLGLLGLGLRGGMVVLGVDGTRALVQREECQLVIVASDASPRAIEKVVRLSQARGIRVRTGPTAAALGERLGRPPLMVVGVRDRRLAAGLVAAVEANTRVDEGA